jgi:hypothetical protein
MGSQHISCVALCDDVTIKGARFCHTVTSSVYCIVRKQTIVVFSACQQIGSVDEVQKCSILEERIYACSAYMFDWLDSGSFVTAVDGTAATDETHALLVLSLISCCTCCRVLFRKECVDCFAHCSACRAVFFSNPGVVWKQIATCMYLKSNQTIVLCSLQPDVPAVDAVSS